MPGKKLFLTLITAAVLALAGVAPALASTWFQTATPDTVDTQTSVSCWSSSGCLSVGDGAMRWNGAKWTAIVEPAATLESVACESATFCLAVGQNGAAADAWRWNGSSWKTVAPANPPSTDNILNAVRCATASNCEAVGTHGFGGTDTFPLAYHWNGTSWSRQSTTGAPHGSLTGVACENTSPSSCEAVGQNFDGTSTGCTVGCPVSPIVLAMGFTGTRWLTQPTPLQPFMGINNADPPPNSPWQDTAISCWSSGCEAVGYQVQACAGHCTGPEAFSELWNGSHWVVSKYGVKCPTSGSGCLASFFSQFNAVHCQSATSCTAAGAQPDPDDVVPNQTLVATFNGTRWLEVATPAPGSTSELFGLSCVNSGSLCTAVGDSSGLGIALRN